jgi:hypothetical protein
MLPLLPLLPLDALEPQALRIVPTDPAATPVSAVRRRNERRSIAGQRELDCASPLS